MPANSTTPKPVVNPSSTDPVFDLIHQEEIRQSDGLELIPSENYVSANVLKAMGSVLTNKYVATLVTVVLGMSLGFGGYAKIWPLFGAANQLLAALALLAVACWLHDLSRRNGMFLLPMAFMLLVTLTSLVLTIREQGGKLLAGTGDFVAGMQTAIAVLLLLLSLVLVCEGWQALRGRRPSARSRD